MLAKIAPRSNDFNALAKYLVSGKPGTHPRQERVAWVFGHNLPTDDPLLAAHYMAAMAAASPRTRNAAYHLMIAWHERELPSADLMQTVARETLELAGLGQHQALVMGHGDKPHRHLHMLINRVHPDTGHAWKTSHDFARFDRIMRQLADAHGFAFVPSHTFNPELTDDQVKLPDSSATYAAKRGAATSRPQWSKRDARTFGAELSEDMDQAAAVDDLEMFLAERGLSLEAKGRGFVIGNATAYAKLSSLRLTCSARSFDLLHATAAKSQTKQARPVFSVDGVDIARAFHHLGLISEDDVRRAIDDAKAVRRQRIEPPRLTPPGVWSSTALRRPAATVKAHQPHPNAAAHLTYTHCSRSFSACAPLPTRS